MTVVGAYARIDPDEAEAIRARIDALSQVSTFELEDHDKVGLLIESSDLGQAHDALTKRIRAIEGVWGIWPIYVHTEETESQAECESA